MPTLKESAERFLNLRSIAITGVSSTKNGVPNFIYNKLKKTGHSIFAINPKGGQIDGDPCFKSLSEVPDKINGVIIATSPKLTLSIVEECLKLGVKHVWIHKSIDKGSYSKEAEVFCRENEIDLIPAGCPLMYCKPIDFPHRCIKWFLHAAGKLPQTLN